MRRTRRKAGEQAKKESSIFKLAGLKKGKNFEHNLATGMIASDQFLAEMKEEVEANLPHINNKAIKQIILWCFEYYDDYGKAPHLNIQDMFEEKKEHLRPANEDIIREFLTRLSSKYEQIDRFDAAYEIERVRRGLDTARMQQIFKQAGQQLREDRLESAQSLVKDYQDSLIQSPGNILEAVKKCLILGQDALEMEETRKPRPILYPWLTGGRITEIYSARGVGKTMLGVILGVALTRESYTAEENDIGPWRVDRPCGVLYVDGEMLFHDLKDRIKRLSVPRGPERAASPLAILSSDKFAGSGASAYLSNINITKAEWRDTIYSILVENRRIKVLILDNLSALMPGVDENSKQHWDPVNQWLLSIRRLGVASIFMHHAGKGNQQRGTSAREDALDTVIKLTRPTGHKYGDMCSFDVSFEKQRHLPPGAASATRSFSLSLVQVDEEGNLAWRASETRTTDNQTLAMAGIFDGMPNKEAMERSGLSAGRISQLRKKMKGLGYIKDTGKPTPTGRDWRKKVEVDGDGLG